MESATATESTIPSKYPILLKHRKFFKTQTRRGGRGEFVRQSLAVTIRHFIIKLGSVVARPAVRDSN